MYFFNIEEMLACLWADKKEPVEREIDNTEERRAYLVLTLDHSIEL